jgi:hypothetical protein
MTGKSRLADQPPIYLELYDALAHFVGRQQLVLRAIADQGVLFAALGRGVSGWYDKTPRLGEWGSEWRFMFHGGGCELRHRRTREPIDRNGPDPASFGPFSFIQHLEWRLKRGDDLPLLRAYVEERGPYGGFAVNDLIDDLIADGLVSPEHHLTPVTDSAPASAA